MGKLGAGRKERSEAGSKSFNFDNILRLSEKGDYVARIIAGCRRKETMFYSTVNKDRDTGEEIFKFASIARNHQTGCILDPVAAADERVRRRHGEDKPRSCLRPSSKFVYVGFYLAGPVELADIGADDLCLMEFPYSVFDELGKLEEMKSPKDPTKLLNGKIFMFDVIISRVYDAKSKKPEQFRTSYSVVTDPETVGAVAGKIPVTYLDLDPDVPEDYDKLISAYEKTLTPDQFAVVQAWASGDMENADELDLDAYTKPNTDEEIVEKLSKNPINISAERDGKPIFPVSTPELAEEFEEAIKDLGIDYVKRQELEEGQEQRAIEEKPAEEKPVEDEKAVKADFEVIEEEPEEEAKSEPDKNATKTTPQKTEKKDEPKAAPKEEKAAEPDDDDGGNIW